MAILSVGYVWLMPTKKLGCILIPQIFVILMIPLSFLNNGLADWQFIVFFGACIFVLSLAIAWEKNY
jgi:hypothetical protein